MMAETPKARRVTRDDLYAMVWSQPMSRLATEFGISGNGLAKICDRLDVPYPPRGYWAKKEAGKPVATTPLPLHREGTQQAAEIHPTLPASPILPEAAESAAAAAQKVTGLTVPNDLSDLHPRVKAWLSEHKKDQQERVQESRRHRHDSWWHPRLLPDLTDRDLYRFRVTSAIFKGVEKAGGAIEKSPMIGRITFKIDSHEVECSIVEKMFKPLKLSEEQKVWTAYPHHHQTGLASSGFLRVSITTYLDGRQSQWIETEKQKIGDILPAIVGGIMAAGPMLEQRKREREERERQYRAEEMRRYEARRRKEIDDKRWNQFRMLAANWEEQKRLRTFLAEIESQVCDKGGTVVSEVPLTSWIAWARKHTEALDPFRDGIVGLFDLVAEAAER
jgi:hypothetical protein